MRSRIILAAWLTVPAAFAYACGGSDATLGDDGGADVTVGNDTGAGNDTGTGNDTGAGNDTGTTADSGGNDAGTTDSGTVDSGSSDASSSLGCTAPSDCTNSFCCGTIVFNGGQIPKCNLADASSECKATCKSSITLSCTATDTVRACATNNDCADAGSNYNKCCTVPFGDAAATFCWNGTFAGAIGGSCQ